MRSYLRNELQHLQGAQAHMYGEVYTTLEQQEQRLIHSINWNDEEDKWFKQYLRTHKSSRKSWKEQRVKHQYDIHKRNNKLQTHSKKEWFDTIMQEYVERDVE